MNSKDSKGFSMIEVLIALLLISVGILGMAVLQVRTLQYTNDAAIRNTAAILGNDLLEIIRTHPDALSRFYKAADQGFPDVPSTGCAPLPQAAEEQLGCWAEKAANTLPGAAQLLESQFYICRTNTANPTAPCSASGDAIQVQLAWQVYKGECVDPEVITVGQQTLNVCTYRIRTRI